MLDVNFSPFPEITTERLLLRKLSEQDAPAMFSLRSSEQVMQYIGRERMTTIAEASGFIHLILDMLDKNEGITWAIALTESPRVLIGTIGLWRIIKEHDRAEIGYMLHPNYWRRGLMQEAICAVVAYGFKTLKLHSIEGRINPLNLASANILSKCGFVKEAHFKEDFLFHGRFEDTAIYSLLSSQKQ